MNIKCLRAGNAVNIRYRIPQHVGGNIDNRIKGLETVKITGFIRIS